MKTGFKVYGYTKDNEENGIQEISKVSLCFWDKNQLKKFSEFLRACEERAVKNSDWEHEHYRTDDGEFDITVDILDERNK